jgi:hypothetical protein
MLLTKVYDIPLPVTEYHNSLSFLTCLGTDSTTIQLRLHPIINFKIINGKTIYPCYVAKLGSLISGHFMNLPTRQDPGASYFHKVTINMCSGRRKNIYSKRDT